MKYGFNFGLAGGGSGESACTKGPGEQWSDGTISCGAKAWGTNEPNYTGTATFDSGKVVVTASGATPAYFSIVPDNVTIAAGMYLLEAKVDAVSAANGWKWSVRATDNSWHDLLASTTTGTFKKAMSVGDITNVNIGHVGASDGDSITFDTLKMTSVDETRTPCMTSYTNPYGEVSASHELTNYWAWRGIDCSNTSSTDAWLTPSIPNGDIDPTQETVWFEWRLTDDDLATGMPLMIPTKVVIAPRKGMNESWYTSNNPYKMRFKGIRADGSMFDIMDYQTDDWIGAGNREIDLPLTEECRGLRVVILGTKGWEGGDALHTGWGASYFEGVYQTGRVTYNGFSVTYNGEGVTYNGN